MRKGSHLVINGDRVSIKVLQMDGINDSPTVTLNFSFFLSQGLTTRLARNYIDQDGLERTEDYLSLPSKCWD